MIHRIYCVGVLIGLEMIDFIIELFRENRRTALIAITVIISTVIYTLRLTNNKVIKAISILILIAVCFVIVLLFINKYNLANYFANFT